MTIKELKEKFAGQYVDVEVYAFNSKKRTLLTDYVDSIDDYSEDEQIDIAFSDLMDGKKYDSTILANCGVSFEEFGFEKNDKILVIVLEESKDERLNRLSE